MYQLNTIAPDTLSKIEVKRQDKIIELTGSPFDPAKAFEVIKKETKDFTKEHQKAREADRLFMELLKLNGIAVQDKMGSNKTAEARMRLHEQERLRSLELLELELELMG